MNCQICSHSSGTCFLVEIVKHDLQEIWSLLVKLLFTTHNLLFFKISDLHTLDYAKSIQTRSFLWSVFSYIQTEYGDLHKLNLYTSDFKSDYMNFYSNLSFLGIKPPCKHMVIAILIKWTILVVALAYATIKHSR